MKIDVILTGPLRVNCSVISKSGKAVIIDPGGDADEIEEFLEKNSLTPLAIVNTHGHFDHIGAVKILTDKYNIPFLMHRDDKFLLAQGDKIMKMYGFGGIKEPEVSENISDGQVLTFGGIEMSVIHTPGHTPGGCCFYLKEAQTLITGDTLFLESVGRSDFPYSDTDALISGITDKLFLLDDDVRVIPGHGAFSSIGHEKERNPYVR